MCIEFYDDGSLGVGSSCPSRRVSLRGYVASPPLCNAHIHLLDSAFVELGEAKPIEELVAQPHGLKYKALASISRGKLVESVRRVLNYMRGEGVLVAISYAELGDYGVSVIGEAARGTGVRVVALPQPREKKLAEMIRVLVEHGGLGMDTALDLEPGELRVLGEAGRGRQLHVHVSETWSLYQQGDYDYALELKPRAAVHGTFWTFFEAKSFASIGSWWILCPRSNRILVGVEPPLHIAYRLWLEGYRRIALGTDNVAWNPPSMWLEISHAYVAAVRATGDPEETARMLIYAATLSCHELAGVEPAVIENGSRPWAVVALPVANIDYSGSPLATTAKRLAASRQEARILTGGR